MDSKSLKELAKSFARYMYFGIVGLVAAFLASWVADPSLVQATWTVPVLEVTLPVGTYIVAGVASLAKALDLYVRKSKNNDRNGIAPQFLQK